MKSYCIKDEYVHRDEYVQYDNTPQTDKFQDEVYAAARQICNQNNFEKIADIGCGSAYKLMKYFRDKDFLGLELEPNLSYIKKKYPLFKFALSDFDNPPEDNFDILICSDVIEHLLEPDELIEFIKKINWKYLVLSTPDREVIQNLQRGFGWDVEENGPPYNEHHIREWTSKEFYEYVSQHFRVIEHFCAPIQKECQIIIATKHNK